jgi:hypothetical protein
VRVNLLQNFFIVLTPGENVIKLFLNHVVCESKKLKRLSLSSFKVTPMEQHALKNVNNCLNTNNYSYLETSGVQSSDPYLNVVHFFNTSVD